MKGILAIVDKTPSKELDEAQRTLLKRARVTKASGCLTVALATVKEPAVLRGQVQAELKELRLHVGKEQEKHLLAGILYEKVQAVLKVEKYKRLLCVGRL